MQWIASLMNCRLFCSVAFHQTQSESSLECVDHKLTMREVGTRRLCDQADRKESFS